MREKNILVFAVRTGGIEMFGTLGKSRVENRFALICIRIGIVPQRAVARGEQKEKCCAHDLFHARKFIAKGGIWGGED